jgi:hypothetical protein
MPLWERVTVWRLVQHQKDRLDKVIETLDETKLVLLAAIIQTGLHDESNIQEKFIKAANIVSGFSTSWESFAGLGNVLEDLVREWFLPTYIGQISSGDEDHYRDIPAT